MIHLKLKSGNTYRMTSLSEEDNTVRRLFQENSVFIIKNPEKLINPELPLLDVSWEVQTDVRLVIHSSLVEEMYLL